MVKKTSIIFTISCLLLFGCSKQEPEIQYIEKPIMVEVPVVQKISFAKPTKPKNYLKNISEKSTPSEIAEAYYNTIKEQQFYIKKLETLIEPFIEQ